MHVPKTLGTIEVGRSVDEQRRWALTAQAVRLPKHQGMEGRLKSIVGRSPLFLDEMNYFPMPQAIGTLEAGKQGAMDECDLLRRVI